jgi:glycerol-3-phosphate cytidylyltransferase
MIKVLTYGTFDFLHIGHINLLERAKKLGDHLTRGLSTDRFNASKGKASFSLLKSENHPKIYTLC